MPTPHQRQNDLRAGKTVVDPMAKTMKSVKEVTVIATPALLIVKLTARGMSSRFLSFGVRLSKHCMITNMSSTPIPRRRNGTRS